MDCIFPDTLFGPPDSTSNDENLYIPDSSYNKDYDHDDFANFDCQDSDHHYNHPFTNFSNHSLSSNWHNQPTIPTDEGGPFSVQSQIPVPDLMPMSKYHLWLESSFMCRRNERERQRVRNVNDGFSRLRNHLPRSPTMKRRQSKVDTLQHAIRYIKYLQSLLGEAKESEKANGS